MVDPLFLRQCGAGRGGVGQFDRLEPRLVGQAETDRRGGLAQDDAAGRRDRVAAQVRRCPPGDDRTAHKMRCPRHDRGRRRILENEGIGHAVRRAAPSLALHGPPFQIAIGGTVDLASDNVVNRVLAARRQHRHFLDRAVRRRGRYVDPRRHVLGRLGDEHAHRAVGAHRVDASIGLALRRHPDDGRFADLRDQYGPVDGAVVQGLAGIRDFHQSRLPVLDEQQAVVELYRRNGCRSLA